MYHSYEPIAMPDWDKPFYNAVADGVYMCPYVGAKLKNRDGKLLLVLEFQFYQQSAANPMAVNLWLNASAEFGSKLIKNIVRKIIEFNHPGEMLDDYAHLQAGETLQEVARFIDNGLQKKSCNIRFEKKEGSKYRNYWFESIATSPSNETEIEFLTS
ncbi:MAG: hypothetical protein AAGI66_09355 [Cyanobacteria bacterium P01_H01_bin.74]